MKTGLAFWSRHTPVRVAALTLVLTLSLAGCDNEKTRNLIDTHADKAKQSLATAENPTMPERYNPLTVTDKVWAGNAALRMHRGMPLPAKVETGRGVTLVSSEPMTLSDIATALSEQTGIPVRLADTGNGAVKAMTATVPVSYEGPMSGLLERIAGSFGVNWHYDGSTISISRFETRVFVMEALPGSEKIEEGMEDDQTVQNQNQAAGSAGSSQAQNTITQNSKFELEVKYWDELGQILTSMLGGTGTVVTAPSHGTVTITTTPELMRTIADYLAQENRRLSRQIAINVEIYSVNLTEGEDFNVSFNAAMNKVASFGGLQYTSALAPSSAGGLSGLGNLNIAILQMPNQNGAVDMGTIFNALSSIGDTTRVAQFPMTTLNNRPVSRRVGHDIAYVAEATGSTTTATTGISTSTVTPGTVHEGFSLQLTPRLLDDGRILLQYSLNLIDLVKISTFNSQCGDTSSGSSSCTSGATGSTTVELPDTTNRIFVQQSLLRSGSTLVIGGVDEEDAGQNAQGVGSPFNFLLGGGSSNDVAHTMVFMAITPQVIDVPAAEHG